MRSLARAVWLVVVLVAPSLWAASAPLAAARKALQAGKLDDVFFALDGKAIPEGERRDAAHLLAEAGQKSLSSDPVFALQFAQTALRDDPSEPLALEVGARACLAEKQFTPAEQYADRWIAADAKGAAARILRAEIANTEGEWQRAIELTDPLAPESMSASDRARWTALRKRARAELADRSSGISTLKWMDTRLDDALAQSAALEREGKVAAPAPSHGVIVYGTSWCGYCRQAREFLKTHDIAFEDKDVEKDPEAAQELARKAAEQHVRPGGVPVIDVDGQLVVGFNRPALESLLHVH